MKKPYTADQLRQNLLLIHENLNRTPGADDRLWLRWVIRDMIGRGWERSAVEDAKPETLEIDPTDSHEWGCTCKICEDYWNTKPPV